MATTYPPEVNLAVTTTWLPLTTAYPIVPSCLTVYHGLPSENIFYLYDPNNFQHDIATPCWPAYGTSWWNQEDYIDTVTSLGPFTCPEAYHTAFTQEDASGSGSEIACCPSGYTASTFMEFAHPGECFSTLAGGQPFTYVDIENDAYITSTTHIPSYSSLVIKGVQLNGWNFPSFPAAPSTSSPFFSLAGTTESATPSTTSTSTSRQTSSSNTTSASVSASTTARNQTLSSSGARTGPQRYSSYGIFWLGMIWVACLTGVFYL